MEVLSPVGCDRVLEWQPNQATIFAAPAGGHFESAIDTGRSLPVTSALWGLLGSATGPRGRRVRGVSGRRAGRGAAGF